DPNTLDIFSKMTDAQRHLFANKLAELPEMSKYYEMKQVAKLSSKYAMRLYELLIAWRSVGKLEISIEGIRNKLGLSVSEYKVMAILRKVS
ncbi:RepB family plasmid replication initiator protein, partial [Corynebacterium diphtheriae]